MVVVFVWNLCRPTVFDPETIQIMPFPNTEGKPSPSPITGWSVGVWSGGKYKREAGKFVEFMFSLNLQTLGRNWRTGADEQATSAVNRLLQNPTRDI